MFKLNRVGSRILELLEDGSEQTDIAKVINHEFNASQKAVENDVREFIEALMKHNLVSES